MSSTAQLVPEQQSPGHERPNGGGSRRWRFIRHYLEMVVAMVAGMAVLGGALRGVLALADVPYSMDRYPALTSVEMGLTMAAGMAVWMRIRRHGWASTLEMSLAMLVPAVAVVPLLWLDVLDDMTAMAVEHVAMLLLMLAVMVRRREEYLAHEHGPSRLGGRLGGGRVARTARRVLSVLPIVGRGLVVLLAFLAIPSATFVADSRAYEQSRYAEPAASAATGVATGVATGAAARTPPAHDPGKPTAVVVVGDSGANVSDALVPYGVLASTGAFNVYTVAPERRPLPLLGGLDLVPDLSFAQLEQRLAGSAPDVTVVPDLPRSEESDATVAAWLRDTAAGDGLLLGVCTGARLLAEAGLLDGREATSHWYRLRTLQRDHPGVNWRRGLRYVDDGDVITTGGLLSSVDGTLRVIERLLGTDAAVAAAETVGWRYYSPGKAATLPESRLTPGDAVTHLLNFGFRANHTTVGVVLTDGVGELELASAFGPYAEVKAARTLAVARTDGAIRSRHGLTFLPRADLDATARVDRLLVPGTAADPDGDVAAAARRADVPVTYLHDQPGFAFEAALREIAGTTDIPTARWTAKILEYPSAGLGLSGPGWPWTLAMRPLLLGLAGLVLVLGVNLVLTRLRRQATARR